MRPIHLTLGIGLASATLSLAGHHEFTTIFDGMDLKSSHFEWAKNWKQVNPVKD